MESKCGVIAFAPDLDDVVADGEENEEDRWARLVELELHVEAADGAIGDALLEIQEQRLYLGSFSTFERYLAERWGMKRTTAYEHIRAADVRQQIGLTELSRSQCIAVGTLPRSEWERTAREVGGRSVKETKKVVARIKRELGLSRPRAKVTPAILLGLSRAKSALERFSADAEELNPEQLVEAEALVRAILDLLPELEEVTPIAKAA